jgi:hypothetical protein
MERESVITSFVKVQEYLAQKEEDGSTSDLNAVLSIIMTEIVGGIPATPEQLEKAKVFLNGGRK